MRRFRYQVACSLDGYIAGPAGEYDWIPEAPEIDFAELFEEFDTLLIGRKTYESIDLDDPTFGPFYEGKSLLVASRTLRPEDHPRVTVVPSLERAMLESLRRRPGKDVWIHGGGTLFRSLLELGFVDTVELAIVPILLGGGIPFLPPPAPRVRLGLAYVRRFEPSGILLLTYVPLPGADS